jgi:hypothetical protein
MAIFRFNFDLKNIFEKEIKMHTSDSSAQQSFEKSVLSSRGYPDFKNDLIPQMLGLRPDFAGSESKRIIEIYSHQGKAIGGQIGKIAKDVLKLAYLKETLDKDKFSGFNFELWLTEECKESIANSWIEKAACKFDIAIIGCLKPDEAVADAQKNQGKHFKKINQERN